MTDNNLPTLPKRNIGMDMTPPYAVYVDGEKIAEHATEDEAENLYAKLRSTHLGKLNPSI